MVVGVVATVSVIVFLKVRVNIVVADVRLVFCNIVHYADSDGSCIFAWENNGILYRILFARSTKQSCCRWGVLGFWRIFKSFFAFSVPE
jgi:hypothetical protein